MTILGTTAAPAGAAASPAAPAPSSNASAAPTATRQALRRPSPRLMSAPRATVGLTEISPRFSVDVHKGPPHHVGILIGVHAPRSGGIPTEGRQRPRRAPLPA